MLYAANHHATLLNYSVPKICSGSNTQFENLSLCGCFISVEVRTEFWQAGWTFCSTLRANIASLWNLITCSLRQCSWSCRKLYANEAHREQFLTRQICWYISVNMNMQTGSGSRWGAIVPPKTYESNFIHIIFYNSENSIRDILPLFYQSSFVKCTSSILQWESRCALTTKDYWNLHPPQPYWLDPSLHPNRMSGEHLHR